jgi:hypothetical protein
MFFYFALIGCCSTEQWSVDLLKRNQTLIFFVCILSRATSLLGSVGQGVTIDPSLTERRRVDINCKVLNSIEKEQCLSSLAKEPKNILPQTLIYNLHQDFLLP